MNIALKHKKQIHLLIIIQGIIFCSSCQLSQNQQDKSLGMDMRYSVAEETYDSALVGLIPPEGTIARGSIPHFYAKHEREKAGVECINPMLTTKDYLLQGKILYTEKCMPCHGQEGNGKGNLVTSGKVCVPVTPLNSDKVQNMTDGEIFHVITMGFNLMESYKGTLSTEERWKIVTYIRENF